jgi:hypothetical protein
MNYEFVVWSTIKEKQQVNSPAVFSYNQTHGACVS